MENIKIIEIEDKEISNKPRITLPYLSKYEKARVLSVRSLEISKGAQLMIDNTDNVSNPIELAKMELKEKKIPFIIVRTLPDGSTEEWKVSELLDISEL
jgi:DNA-directed RNA polymerase I, II, and III subunit RPABC2